MQEEMNLIPYFQKLLKLNIDNIELNDNILLGINVIVYDFALLVAVSDLICNICFILSAFKIHETTFKMHNNSFQIIFSSVGKFVNLGTMMIPSFY